MDEKLTIDALIEGVKNGKLTLDDVPTNYKAQVTEVIK